MSMQDDDDKVLHQDAHEEVIDEAIEAGVGEDNAAIASFVAITGGEAPTEAEFNALGAKVNSILAALRNNGIVDT